MCRGRVVPYLCKGVSPRNLSATSTFCFVAGQNESLEFGLGDHCSRPDLSWPDFSFRNPTAKRPHRDLAKSVGRRL